MDLEFYLIADILVTKGGDNMKCYVLVKPDGGQVYGVYKNKTDAEKDMHRLDGLLQMEYDDIQIREVEFKNTASRFYTVNYFHGIDAVYIYEMTEEAIMVKRNYTDQSLVFSIDADSELASDLKKIKSYGMNIAKSIDESVLHLLNFISCYLEPMYTSNTTLSVVNTKVINDLYDSTVDKHPELEYALNTALSCVEKKLSNRLEPVFTKYLRCPINDQTLYKIKEDMYAELDFEYGFRRNPSLIPLVRDVINSNRVMS